ncbi:acyl-CoA dehydrogenase family protein [Phenylobacterium soli]|uniref:Acyl-CoA dehydrogenase n=1 Tax=Phenylobacterium soli TaxID=2170551 RepID=A0A328AMU5_9CAUL|nr:acyl-CoA dehydrogenase family protein [Phenylobacterium soli]RAK54218.1 acyl-CoA dehydrogenase [Phenylobacterium soli]
MELGWSAEDARFRDEVRAFLDAELTPELRRAGRGMTSVYADPEISLAWQRILHRKGWVAPAWPKAFGGCEWSVAQRYIFAGELAAAGAPPLSPMGLGMCGPVLIAHGTPAQQARFLPPMLSGEDFWCQGYSEPEAGSDLAALKMSARDEGDHFVCDGVKVWTTHAHAANWMFCLVRTSQEAIRQRGITFLLIDMTSPGVEVKPLVFSSGEHIQNQVFFSGVRVPKENVVGRVGEGWSVAKHLMQFERGGSPSAPGLKVRLARTAEALKGLGTNEEARAYRRRAAELAMEVEALEAVELRVNAGLSRGEAPGPESSLLKTVSTELSQKLVELALAVAGAYAGVWQPHAAAPGGDTPGFASSNDREPVGPEHAWTAAPRYFNDRAGTIYAGTSEVQRNIMAKAVLGL